MFFLRSFPLFLSAFLLFLPTAFFSFFFANQLAVMPDCRNYFVFTPDTAACNEVYAVDVVIYSFTTFPLALVSIAALVTGVYLVAASASYAYSRFVRTA
ncbi:hypothetical protein [Alkalicoccus luteus]|uniref:Uncharacterized protein n=1 Tax=Alkalicoccus luteus TaxID=1237094 RepID=A0A969TWS9_9BACI|nr:hypothetical protein [Alkalicoccus luteus]NJP37569.1 hypothetical protein [Alkalicoccus luteus]